MKDWKSWAVIIGIYLLFKMCGGCDGCGSSRFDMESVENAIEIHLISKVHADPHITTIKQTSDNPPTYRFEYEYLDRNGIRQHRTGSCTFYEDGQIRDLNW